MIVKLLEFDILGTPHTLYVTDERDVLGAVETTVSSGILAAATYSCITTSVHLNSRLSPGAAVRSFFHEVYELTLSTLSFTHDPYHPHDSFSALSDVVFGVFKSNAPLLFQDVLADAYRECIKEHFAVDGGSEVEARRVFHPGGMLLTRDELDYYLELAHPGEAPFTASEISAIVKKVSEYVVDTGGIMEEHVKSVVNAVVSERPRSETQGSEEAKC